jgi:hypothetical protein
MNHKIEDAPRLAAAQTLAVTDGETVNDTGIPEARQQRDECYMLLMKALHPTAKAKQPFTTTELEKLTLRSGIPLLMLPNGWARVNELAQGEYGLQSEYVRCQRWKIRPEFYAVNPWDISERALGHQIDIVFDNWDPDNLMNSEQTKEFYSKMAGLQHEMVHKTVAERVGILGSQLEEYKKEKIEEVVEIIQTFLRAGVPDPFKVQEIQKAIAELRSDPFAMDAMKLLVEDMSAQTKDEFAMNQLTAILGELNVAAEADNNSPVVAASDSNGGAKIKNEESDQSSVGQIKYAGETWTQSLTFREH